MGNHPFGIGDTLSAEPGAVFDEIPVFAPECFALIRCAATAKAKQFRAGLTQFVSEGVIQLYGLASGHGTLPLLGAVGQLQFEVLKHRLESEYGAEVVIEPKPWNIVRWILVDGVPVTGGDPPTTDIPTGSGLARDPSGRWTFLAEGEWVLRALVRYQPDWELVETPG